MRSDMVPGAIFPDYELSDYTAKRRKLSELNGGSRDREPTHSFPIHIGSEKS
jgi:hypothetical protein